FLGFAFRAAFLLPECTCKRCNLFVKVSTCRGEEFVLVVHILKCPRFVQEWRPHFVTHPLRGCLYNITGGQVHFRTDSAFTCQIPRHACNNQSEGGRRTRT